MQPEDYPAYLKKQSYDDLLAISCSIDKEAQAKRYEMVSAEIAERVKRGEKKETQGYCYDSPLILFPEIIGVAVVTFAAPFWLVKVIISGHVSAGIAGFTVWFTALFFTVRFVRRRQYFFALLPMLAMLGLAYFIQKGLSQ